MPAGPWSPTDRNRTATFERETLLDSLVAPRSLLGVRQAPPLERIHGLSVRGGGHERMFAHASSAGRGAVKGCGETNWELGGPQRVRLPAVCPWPVAVPLDARRVSGVLPHQRAVRCRVLRCRCRFCMEKRASL